MRKELKRVAARDNNYEAATKIRDLQRDFNEQLLSIFEVTIKNK